MYHEELGGSGDFADVREENEAGILWMLDQGVVRSGRGDDNEEERVRRKRCCSQQICVLDSLCRQCI